MVRSTLSLVLLHLWAAVSWAEPIPITGRVLDATSLPLGEVTVSLVSLPGRYDATLATLDPCREPAASVTTYGGGDGRFRIDAPESGPWRLRIEAPDRVALELDLMPLVVPTRLPPVTLHRPVWTDVRVVDADGHGIVGAEVTTTGDIRADRAMLWSYRACATTDEQGRARLPRLETVAANVLATRVRVGDDAWLALDSRVVDESRETVEVPTLPMATVGFVRAGQPAAGTVIEAPGGSIARLDERGLLVWPETVFEQLARWVVLDDGIVTDFRDALRPQPSDEGSATIDPVALAPATLDPVTLHLGTPEAKPFRGRVVDTQGAPIADALVWDAEAPEAYTRTNGDGSFSLVMLSRGAVSAISATHEGYVLYRSSAIGASPLPDIVLRSESTVGARVVAPDGRPVAGVLAEIRFVGSSGLVGDQPTSPYGTWGPRADDDGRIVLRKLIPGGRYRARLAGADVAETSVAFDAPARSADHRTRTDELVWQLAADSEPTAEATAPRPAARAVPRREQRAGLMGRVVDADGSAVAQAEVNLSWPTAGSSKVPTGRRAFTNSSGLFHVRDIPARRVTLEAADGQWRSEPVELDLSTGQSTRYVDVRLTIDGAILGGVVSDARGAAVSGAQVSASQRGATVLSGGHVSATTDAAGRFELRGLFPGDARLDVHVADGRREVRRLTLVSGHQTVDIELPVAIRLGGVVVDDGGQPVSGVTVGIRTGPHRSPVPTAEADVSTGADGRFALGSVPTPVSAIQLDRPGAVSYLVAMDELVGGPLVDGRDDLRLTLPRGARLDGSVSGRPSDLARARLSAACMRLTQRSTGLGADLPLDDEGRFTVDGLTPCVWTVSMKVGQRDENLDVRVDEGDAAVRAEFELVDDFTVSGLVTLDEVPLENAMVLFRGASRWYLSARTDEAGRFEAADAIPGAVTVVVNHRRLGPRGREVPVTLLGEDHLVIPLASTTP